MTSFRFRRAVAAWLLLIASAPTSALAADADPPDKATTLVVYGNDQCPQSSGDEIVVCARRPEGDRYRIPKSLRHKDDPLMEKSFTAQMQGLEEASRSTMPNSCSPIGSYGQTGCTMQMLHQWYMERRQMKAEAAETP